MNMPGYSAQASLGPASQVYRVYANFSRGGVLPAMSDLMVIDPYTDSSGSGRVDAPSVIVSTYCRSWLACCRYGSMGCCLVFDRDCRDWIPH